MYLRILKKDLKRKKTMNIILFIFIALAAAFISSSSNNLFTVTNAVGSYFKKAGLSDYLITTIMDEKNDEAIQKFLNENEYVKKWSRDENLYLVSENIKLAGGKKFELSNIAFINSWNISQQKFFDNSNKEITELKKGEIYLQNKLMKKNNLHSGDMITIKVGDFSMDFKIKGGFKDAFLGSSMMGAFRLLVNDSDYSKLRAGSVYGYGYIYSIYTKNQKAFEKDFHQMGLNSIVACSKSLVASTYIMDMVIAGLLLVVSIFLILISMVILRFTIIFTLNDEFREIGIMKAIGIKGRRIRGLYIIKYLAVSVIGSAVGFLLGVPFGQMLLKDVSGEIIISESETGLMISIISSVFIVAIILLFCYSCTRKVNKISPVDAIRNGSNGERFKKKGLFNLSGNHLPAVLFMALNDILSGLKKYGALIITFTLGILLIIVPVNSINTLKSDKLVPLFGMVKSDIYMENENNYKDFKLNGRNYLKKYLADMEAIFSRNGIPATAFCEVAFKFKISKNNSSYISFAQQGTNTTADLYQYTVGQPPQYPNEVAVSQVTADKIDAKIGDTVKIKTGDKENGYMVTAIFQSLNNLGEGIRFSEKADLDYSYMAGISGVQVKFTDNRSVKEIKEYKEKIERLYPDYIIRTGEEYINNMLGGICESLQSIKKLIVSVIILINVLVAILMEKTFITKERGEVGLLKSLGFSNTALTGWQASRIGIILFISSVLGILISKPITQVTSGRVFAMMGTNHINFVIKPLEVYLFYPLIVFLATLAASILTALQIRKISAHEINNIE